MPMISYIKNRYGQRTDVVAAIVVEKPMQFSALIDGFDAMVLVVSDEATPHCFTHHYSREKSCIQERWYDCATFEKLLSPGGNVDVQHWVIAGEIVLDQRGYMKRKRDMLLEVTPEKRAQRLFEEFALFLRHFLLSKTYLENGDVLDAHSHILTAVHHWARISVVEQGFVPELTVWKQVRKVNAGIFKLYEELTMNAETLEQRIRLAHLACDFSVISKLKECCEPLLRIVASRTEPWSVAELERHPVLQPMQTELPVLLKKLVRKSFIREVLVMTNADPGILEMKYTS